MNPSNEQKDIKMKKERTSNYIFTADPQSVADMQQIAIVKKTVKAMNDAARQAHVYARRNAIFRCEPVPKAPTMKRVRLLGRGPRVQAALNDYGRRRAYDSYLPQRYATSFDVYIADVR
jgi:hypothetical protein